MWRGPGSLLLRRLSSTWTGAPGFVGIPGLAQPTDWHRLVQDAVARCEGLVGDVVRAPPSAAVVGLLDDISDTLCQVLDAAEFCRNVHADEEWRRQAQQACMELNTYVQQLNLHYGLYSALVKTLQHYGATIHAAERALQGSESGTSTSSSGYSSSSSSSNCSSAGLHLPAATSAAATAAAERLGFDAETVLVGRMLQRDFERYGVHLSGSRRDAMTAAVHRAQQLGMHFVQNVVDPAQLASLELRGAAAAATTRLPQHLRKRFRPLTAPGGSIAGLSCPAETSLLHSLLRESADESLRKAAFEACNTQPAANLAVLDQLVEARHEVARLMGYDSYSQYQLDSFSLASTPAAVSAFLERFATAIQPKCRQEAAVLAQLKAQALSGGTDGSSSSGFGSRVGGTTSRSTTRAASGQVQPWDRLWLADLARSREESEALAALPAYFELERVVQGLSDLLRRCMGVALQEVPLEPGEGWAPGVRKLQAVHDTEGFLGTVYLDLYRRPHKFPSNAHFTLRCGRRLPDSSYQTPVVALVSNMAPHAGLAMSEVEMLFHEFGHALNSLLSRTRYQHLSGTRGPPDLVEAPSHTLELFAADPRVLALYARHRTTGEPLPPRLLHCVQDSKQRFAGLEQEMQLQYALIDQLLHGPDPPTGHAAQQAIADIMRRHSVLGHAEGTHPHIRFTHVVGYGANYYSYLFAQCLAAQVWHDHLAADPTGRAAGELLRHRLLQPGGAKEPHRMVQDLLSPSPHSGSSDSGSGSSSGNSSSSNSRNGSGSATASQSTCINGLCQAGGGWHPDPAAMLRQQQLLVH